MKINSKQFNQMEWLASFKNKHTLFSLCFLLAIVGILFVAVSTETVYAHSEANGSPIVINTIDTPLQNIEQAPLNVGNHLQIVVSQVFTTPVAPPENVGGAEAPPAGAEESGEVILNEVKLIDTIVEWLAWVWMCIGVGAILLILLIFPFLQMRGSQLKQNEK